MAEAQQTLHGAVKGATAELKVGRGSDRYRQKLRGEPFDDIAIVGTICTIRKRRPCWRFVPRPTLSPVLGSVGG